MTDKGQKRLGEMLIEKGLITPEQLTEALEEQKRTKNFLGTILLKRKQVKETDLLQTLSEQLNVPFVDLDHKYIDWEFLKKFSSSLILEHKFLPLHKQDFSITIATANPLDPWALQKAEEETRGFKIKLVLVSETAMEDAIQRYKQHIKGNISKLLE